MKIIDISSSDSGVYACIGKRSVSLATLHILSVFRHVAMKNELIIFFSAGNSHAETQLIVKFRSKEQISSEEYLRLGNSVHLQHNANLDSAPANSGESPYTDHAGKRNTHFLKKFICTNYCL